MELTIEDLYGEIERLKKRVDWLESALITREDIEIIEDFLKKKQEGKLELIGLDEAMKELGIDESEIREEISKETKKT